MPAFAIDRSREPEPLALFATIAYQGFVFPIMGLGSLWISRRFGFDTAGLARAAHWGISKVLASR
jgi:hypothetical protein